MPKGRRQRILKNGGGPRKQGKYIKRYTEPYTLEPDTKRKTANKIMNVKKGPVDFDSLARSLDAGVLKPGRVIDEIELDRAGSFKPLKRGGYKLTAGVGIAFVLFLFNYTNSLKGDKTFDRVIHVVVSEATAGAINRIRELGGSIKTRNPRDDEPGYSKFTNLSETERKDPEKVKKAAAEVAAKWGKVPPSSGESIPDEGVKVESLPTVLAIKEEDDMDLDSDTD